MSLTLDSPPSSVTASSARAQKGVLLVNVESRVKVLRVIAERYLELVDPMQGPSGISGDGGSSGFMPDTYSPTVREFERLMSVMKYDRHRSLVVVASGKHTWVGEFIDGRRCVKCGFVQTNAERASMRYGGEEPLSCPTEKCSVRQLRWHVLEWFVNARTVPVHHRITPRKGQKLGVVRDQDILRDKSGAVVPSRVELRVHRLKDARLVLAEAGLAWMASEWSLKSEPMLPNALVAAA